MSSRTRSIRRLRRLGVGLLIAVAVLWLARDLPRWIVQTVAADLLQGQVRLDGLRIKGWRQLDLVGLEIESPAILPMVERVAVDEVSIEGRLRQILAARVERLTLRGMAARLITSVELEEGSGEELAIGELRIEPAAVTVVGAAGAASALTLEGSLRDVGGATAGAVSVRSPALELVPLLELATLWVPEAETAAAVGAVRLVGLAAEVEIGEHPHLTLRADRGELEVEGLELQLGAPEFEVRSPADRYELTLDVATARASTESRRLDLGAVSLTATAAEAENRIHFAIGAELEMAEEAHFSGDWDSELGELIAFEGKIGGFDLGRFAGDLGADGELRLDADADVEIRGEGPDLAVVATVRPRALDLDNASIVAERALLTISGQVPLENLKSPRKLEGGVRASFDLPAVTGTFGGWKLPAAAFPAKIGFDGKVAGGPGAALQGTWTLTSKAAGRVAATGGLHLEETQTGPLMTADLAWTWGGSELGSLARLLEGPVEGGPAAGRLSGRGRLRGALLDPEVHAELKLDDGSVEIADSSWSVAEMAAKLVLDWRPHPRPPGLRVTTTAVFRYPDLEPIPFTLQATVPVAPDLKSGALRDTVMEAPGLGRFEADGSWRREGGLIDAEGIVRAKELDLAGWQSTLRLDIAGLAFKGLASAELNGSLAGGGWQLQGPVELDGTGFSSSDGGRVLEGLAADWTVEVSGGGERPIAARADGTSSGFLVLWGTFFADLSSLEAQWHVDADLETADEAWRLAAEILVPDGPAIEAGLQRPVASPGGLDYTVDVRVEDLALTHDRYLRPILDERFDRPELGGKLTASLRGDVDSDSGSSVRGDFRLEDLGWEAGGELVLTGFDLDLPLDLRFASASGGERLRGRMSFERLSFRGLELPPARTGLWTENDGLELEDPLSFQILEGSITLGRLKLGDLLQPGRYLESSLSLTDLSLGRISEALEVFPLEGTLEGRLPRVRLSADALRVDGGGEIGVFGGTVRLSDISGTDVFTPFPSMTLSAEFSDVDLGRLTRRLDFGEMTGILRGSITDCELFRKLPVRCSARFETVTQRGVSRTVDVKAINNLSILGTGAGTNVFDRGLQRFLDRYRYERLGVEIRLDNDVLLLRGLETRGERELFMKGRFPFPIDIVNAQPGRTVSFQAMLRRLQSLDFSTATTSPKKR